MSNITLSEARVEALPLVRPPTPQHSTTSAVTLMGACTEMRHYAAKEVRSGGCDATTGGTGNLEQRFHRRHEHTFASKIHPALRSGPPPLP